MVVFRITCHFHSILVRAVPVGDTRKRSLKSFGIGIYRLTKNLEFSWLHYYVCFTDTCCKSSWYIPLYSVGKLTARSDFLFDRWVVCEESSDCRDYLFGCCNTPLVFRDAFSLTVPSKTTLLHLEFFLDKQQV